MFNTFTTPSLLSQGATSSLDLPFLLALSIVPAFLLSLRILANPTRRGIFPFDEAFGSNLSDLMSRHLNYLKCGKTTQVTGEMISDAERIDRIRSDKEQVISFYFSFVGSTMILLYLFILLQIEKTKGTFDPLSTFPCGSDNLSSHDLCSSSVNTDCNNYWRALSPMGRTS